MSGRTVHPSGPRRDRVLAVLSEATAPMSLSQVIRAIGESTPYNASTLSVVSRVLHDLFLAGDLVRSGSARSYAYRLPDRARPAPAPAAETRGAASQALVRKQRAQDITIRTAPPRPRTASAAEPETIVEFLARGGVIEQFPAFGHAAKPQDLNEIARAPRTQRAIVNREPRRDALDEQDELDETTA